MVKRSGLRGCTNDHLEDLPKSGERADVDSLVWVPTDSFGEGEGNET